MYVCMYGLRWHCGEGIWDGMGWYGRLRIGMGLEMDGRISEVFFFIGCGFVVVTETLSIVTRQFCRDDEGFHRRAGSESVSLSFSTPVFWYESMTIMMTNRICSKSSHFYFVFIGFEIHSTTRARCCLTGGRQSLFTVIDAYACHLCIHLHRTSNTHHLYPHACISTPASPFVLSIQAC